MSKGGAGIDLLNIRYFLKPASTPDPNPIYTDANWKVYANPGARPRAWVEPGGAEATIREHTADHIAVSAPTAGPGMLVLSELYYPGWEAHVNGRPVLIEQVDGGLRGIPISPGDNLVTVDYAPRSVLSGAILSGLAFALSLAAAVFWLRR